MSTEIDLQFSDRLRHFGLTDNLGTFAPGAPTFADTVTITDTLIILEAGFINIPLEGVSFSDSVSLILGLQTCLRELSYASAPDAVACSAVVGDPPPFVAISDNLDNVIAGINQTLSEAIVLSVSLNVPANVTVNLSDTITITDDGGTELLGMSAILVEYLTNR